MAVSFYSRNFVPPQGTDSQRFSIELSEEKILKMSSHLIERMIYLILINFQED